MTMRWRVWPGLSSKTRANARTSKPLLALGVEMLDSGDAIPALETIHGIGKAEAPRRRRVKMVVWDAYAAESGIDRGVREVGGGGILRQPGVVVVGDIRDVRVEDVENIELKKLILHETLRNVLSVPDGGRRGMRISRRIQLPWPEVAHPQAG